MSLPRRVPWYSLKELDQVYGSIYLDEDWTFAINRLATWKFACGLPLALEATLLLLTAKREDLKNVSAPLSIRQSYALAIIRFVNGLVDPLQMGTYARSIAAIAAQIDLPLSLVEIRHAATHEGLPSLVVLREASNIALAWIQTQYFVPMLSQESVGTSEEAIPALQPLLKHYKSIMKSITRDRSLQVTLESDLQKSLRKFDLWMSETSAALRAWDADPLERESLVLERLAKALTESGGLIPVSKRKQPSDMTVPTLDLWTPLMYYLQDNHPGFGSIVVETIVSQIVPSDRESEVEDGLKTQGYLLCLSAWLVWIAANWNRKPGCDAGSISETLLKNLIRGDKIPPHLEQLFQQLMNHEPQITPSVNTLLNILQQATDKKSTWSQDALDVMQERLLSEDYAVKQNDQTLSSNAPRGWRLLDEASGWKPCPIGS